METLNQTALELADGTNVQCSQASTVSSAGIHALTSPPASASVQELKRLISEGVLETCTEWLKTCNEEELYSDQEESEDDNEQGCSSSTLAKSEALSLAPITTVPDQWSWYADLQTAGTSTEHPDFSMPPPNLPRTHPPHAAWATLPPFDLLPTLDCDFSTASATPCGPIYMGPLPTQTTDSAMMQPQMAQSSGLDSTLVPAHDVLDDWELWDQSSMPAQIGPSLPEANQDP
jgi:hypothetical protein